jgi:hypothetical protein
VAKKAIGPVFVVAGVALALSLTVVWRTVQGRSSTPSPPPQQAYLGKWKFTSGEVKTTGGFHADKPGPDGRSSGSLVGHSAVVEERDGVLWYTVDGKNCSYELRVGDEKAEVPPDGKIDCDTSGGGNKQQVRLSMVVDAKGQAHISCEARASFQIKGQQRDVTVSFEGIAVRDVPAAK